MLRPSSHKDWGLTVGGLSALVSVAQELCNAASVLAVSAVGAGLPALVEGRVCGLPGAADADAQ